jgi:hypothetical protein
MEELKTRSRIPYDSVGLRADYGNAISQRRSRTMASSSAK